MAQPNATIRRRIEIIRIKLKSKLNHDVSISIKE